jgi:sulfatase maturation enzyme AslB (radical SAM superfamily)
MTLTEAKTIFTPEFVNQLRMILAEGNFGDMQMNPYMIDIWRYLKSIAPATTRMMATTNGGARDKNFWESLAALDIDVIFSIDGLEDTNHLYRQDVNWHRLMTNVKNFIAKGGRATWKFIEFNHNQHQIETARTLANEMGFYGFYVVNQSTQKNQDHRQRSVVFDRTGATSHVIGPWTGPTDFETVKSNFEHVPEFSNWAQAFPKPNSVDCEVFLSQQIFINSVGDVFPCCYLAQASGNYCEVGGRSHITDQVKAIAKRNNALTYSVRECIEWFRDVESAWSKNSIAEGRIVQCDHNCGDKRAPLLLRSKEQRDALDQKSA